MSDRHDSTPPPDSPPLNGFGRPARRRGAASNDATPRMETVRVTAPIWSVARCWRRRAAGW